MKKCTAILGPFDQPNGKVEVEVIRPHDMPGFFVCVYANDLVYLGGHAQQPQRDTGRQRLVVHWQKLAPLG